MSTGSEFWWNWWVNFGVAVTTLCAVLVALFGDWIRGHLFSPKLELELRSSVGEKTIVSISSKDEDGNLRHRTEDVRYYHVNVINKARWPRANQVQVYLLRIEEPGPDDELNITWSGEVPIRWRHQEIYPLARSIGSTIDCDLCSVVKNKLIQLHPLIVPNNLVVARREPTKMVVSLQARANEGESAIQRFQISWDGKWADGESEMLRHFVVKEMPN